MVVSTSEKVSLIERAFGSGYVHNQDVVVRCPICNDPRPEKLKLSIRLDNFLTHCWVCGWSAYGLTQLLKRFAPDLLDEYKRMHPGDGISRDAEETPVEIPQVTLPEDFKMIVAHQDDPYTLRLRSYLEERGHGLREMWRWKLGFSREGKWFNRIIVPSFDASGELNYVVGRTITNAVPKYLNSFADRDSVVFNELDVDWQRELVLVEGPFDLMKCRMNATCLLGSFLSEGSLLFDKIMFYHTPIVLMLDPDARKKMLGIARKLSSKGIQVRCAMLEDNDPGDMTFEETERAVKSAQRVDDLGLMRLKLAGLSDRSDQPRGII